jgi:hypothetical protein
VFFLYLRCLLERELKVKFSKIGSIGKTYVEMKDVNLSIKQCRKISSIFFEHDPDSQNKFIDMLEKEGFKGEKTFKIPAIKFLILML